MFDFFILIVFFAGIYLLTVYVRKHPLKPKKAGAVIVNNDFSSPSDVSLSFNKIHDVDISNPRHPMHEAFPPSLFNGE